MRVRIWRLLVLLVRIAVGVGGGVLLCELVVKASVILNPYANRWRARERARHALAALGAAGVSYDLIETGGPREAIQAAREAAGRGVDAVIAAGGDGSVSEVVNGLFEAAGDGETVALGILPLGTGNDFADMAGVPRDLNAAARVIAGGESRLIDVGIVTYTEVSAPLSPVEAESDVVDAVRVTRRYFDNNCAAAMEPMVTIENTRIRRVSGNLRYVISLFRALRKLRTWHMKIAWDGGGYEGPVHLLSVCNSPRCGGLFTMAPGAELDDGRFDYVFAPKLTKLEILRLLPRLFRGTHLNWGKIVHGRSRRIVVESVPGTPIHADGEVLTESAQRIDFEILPGKLRLLTGDPSAGGS